MILSAGFIEGIGGPELMMIMFVILLSITLLVFKSSGRWVYYESERKR